MQQNQIIVTAFLRIKDGQATQAQNELIGLVAPTRAEPGCIAYDLYRSSEKNGCFMFYECWRSRQDLDEHLRKPHIRSFMKKADSFLAEPLRVSVWEKLTDDKQR